VTPFLATALRDYEPRAYNYEHLAFTQHEGMTFGDAITPIAHAVEGDSIARNP
jgi:hypothetical protein